MANSGQQGAGKQGRKDTQEPYPHTKDHKGGSSSHSGGAKASGGTSSGASAKGGSNASSDLKSREYKDARGNIHHHTRTAGKSGGK